ncbi:hypothetical protein LTR86_007828 [Recurvomyces mirabilis]|nr:hypothetical protein LTR86_007828 [Recurvomyces mirabilis]
MASAIYESLLREAPPSAGTSFFLLLIAAPCLYTLNHIVYNLFFHPLRTYSGPLLWRMTRLPNDWHTFRGDLFQTIARLHNQHGPIIRVSPNALSYADSQAYHDILAHKPGQPEWPKDPAKQNIPPNGIPHILGADKENHARYRRLLAHAFSEKGLQEQQGTILQYVDLLIKRLGAKADSGEVINIVEWFNMTVFDVIGDLAWGASFQSLESSQVHEWIGAVYANLTFVMMSGPLRAWGLGGVMPRIMPKAIQEGRVKSYRYMKERLDERLKVQTARGDFWDRVLIKSKDENAGGEGMTEGEMLNNAAFLVLAGSETSATTLSGAVYLLCKHPKVMKRLVEEVRSAFDSQSNVNVRSVSQLKYLDAVLEEAMRIYPPVPTPSWRIPPKGGAVACERFVPEGVSVNVSVVAACREPTYWHRHDDFLPERWLDDAPAEFADDNRAAFQPFSVGTRNCIGRNLAYAEMRLVLTKVLWAFDLQLEDKKTGDWFDQKGWGLWDKKPLYVRLSQAHH